MNLDACSLRLLEYLERRVSATIGDNQERIGRALGLSRERLAGAIELLCAGGLVSREALADSVFVLRITDPGIRLLQVHRLGRPPLHRPWWKFW